LICTLSGSLNFSLFMICNRKIIGITNWIGNRF